MPPTKIIIYINDVAAGEAVALKLSEGAVTSRYEIGEAPHGLGLSADGKVLFATSQGDERVTRIELYQNASKSVQLAPAPYHLAVSPVDGRILVTSRGEARLWVLDPVSLAIVDEVLLDGIGHQISIEGQ
ncbi:YncE family protein [Marinobacter sp.]|uniref:YncE family protein n=1 Tax=Marinobacter sp. TaxID=50741 RepID=UPI003A92B68F